MEIKYDLINLDFSMTEAFLSFSHPGSNTRLRKRASKKLKSLRKGSFDSQTLIEPELTILSNKF